MTKRSHHTRLRKEPDSDDPLLAPSRTSNLTRAQHKATRHKAAKTMFGEQQKATMRFNRGVQLGCINWPIEIPENVEVTKCPTVYAWGVQLR